MKPGNDFSRASGICRVFSRLARLLHLRCQEGSSRGATHSPEPSAGTALTETISAGSGRSCA